MGTSPKKMLLIIASHTCISRNILPVSGRLMFYMLLWLNNFRHVSTFQKQKTWCHAGFCSLMAKFCSLFFSSQPEPSFHHPSIHLSFPSLPLSLPPPPHLFSGKWWLWHLGPSAVAPHIDTGHFLGFAADKPSSRTPFSHVLSSKV